MITLFFAQTTMRGLLNVFVVLVATSVPGGSEALAGSLFVAMGAGGLVGASVGAALGGCRGALWLALGLCLWGLPVVVIGLWTGPTVAWFALLALGLGNALLDVFGFSLAEPAVPRSPGRPGLGRPACGGRGDRGARLARRATPGLAPRSDRGDGVGRRACSLRWLWLAWPWLWRIDAQVGGRQEDIDLLRRVPLFTDVRDRARAAGAGRPADHHGR